MPRASIATLLSLVMCTSTFAGCEATLKDGIATCGADDDRPTGFECRAEAGDDTRYCFSQRAQVAKVSDVGGQGDSGSSAGRDAESSGATGGGAGRGGSSGSLATDAGDSGTGRNGGSGDSGGKAPGASPASSTRVYSLKRASSRRWGTGKPWESKPPPGDGPDRPAWMHKWMLRCPRPAPSRPVPKGRARAGRRPGHGRIARHDRRGGDQASHRLKPIPRRSGR